MADRRPIIIRAQYKKAISTPDEYVKYIISDDDISTWYVLLGGMDGNENEFMQGEFLVRIKLPINYPYSPPEFYFMTPQGVYDVEKKVCISIGEYHSDNYRAVLGVPGFCAQL